LIAVMVSAQAGVDPAASHLRQALRAPERYGTTAHKKTATLLNFKFPDYA
jgi:hypothetical protein